MYSFLAKHDFQIDTRLVYSSKLKRPGEYGNYLEFRAPSELHIINIKIFRLFNNEHYFVQAFVHGEECPTIWLLFAGGKTIMDIFGYLHPLITSVCKQM